MLVMWTPRMSSSSLFDIKSVAREFVLALRSDQVEEDILYTIILGGVLASVQWAGVWMYLGWQL